MNLDTRKTVVSVLLILLLGFWLRIHHLEADAPLGISPTPELSLDGPSTIPGGRDLALFGGWQPFPGPRPAHVMYPFMNWLAFLFFKALGVGYWQANFISVVLGLLAVALAMGFARQQFGRRAALFAGLFLALNYVLVIYNRDPMAYTAVTTGMMLSLYAWGRGWQQPGWFFLSGAVTLFTTLFIKLPAIVFAPAAFVGFAWHIGQQHKWRELRAYWPALLFGFGAGLVFVAWYLFLYQAQTGGVESAYYFRTLNPAMGLEANLRAGLWSVLYMGLDFGLVWRMLPMFALAYGYSLLRLLHLFSRQCPALSPAEATLLTFLLGALGMLLVSLARPLRFQIILIPLLSLVAALALDRLWQKRPFSPPARFGRLFPLVLFAGLTYFLYQLLAALVALNALQPWQPGFAGRWYNIPVPTAYLLLMVSMAVALPLVLAYLLFATRQRWPGWLTAVAWQRVTAVVLVCTAVGFQLFQYATMLQDLQFSTVASARQIAQDLPAETTIMAGPFAYPLALESELPAIWMLGGDERKFLDYDYTHLVVDVTGPYEPRYYTEVQLRDTVPELFDDALLVGSYMVRGYTVHVYQMPPATED